MKIDRNAFSEEDLKLIENGGISVSDSDNDIDVIFNQQYQLAYI